MIIYNKVLDNRSRMTHHPSALSGGEKGCIGNKWVNSFENCNENICQGICFLSSIGTKIYNYNRKTHILQG